MLVRLWFYTGGSVGCGSMLVGQWFCAGVSVAYGSTSGLWFYQWVVVLSVGCGSTSGLWFCPLQATGGTSSSPTAVSTSTWRSGSSAATWTCWCRPATAAGRWPPGAWPPPCYPRPGTAPPTAPCWLTSQGAPTAASAHQPASQCGLMLSTC